MQAGMKRVIAQEGIDSSQCLLFAYGGAGPAHCAYYSAGLGFPKIIIPPMASTFSAFGASTTDILHRYEASCFSWFSDLPYDPITLRYALEELKIDQIPSEIIERLNSAFQSLDRRANLDMEIEGFSKDQIIKKFEIEARYGGQLWEIVCPVSINQINSTDDFKTIIHSFEEEYVKAYTKAAMVPRGGVEIISVALTASVPIEHRIISRDNYGKDPSAAMKGERDVYFEGKWEKTKIYDLERLHVGNRINGNAIIEGRDTTIVVPNGYRVSIDPYLNLLMENR
jgi:N-methylhydantoinase A/oxoprolinase/acetone carboxylase beta subunit